MIAAFFLFLLFVTGLTVAQYSLEDNISVDLVQSINGTGFFSTYRNLNMPDPLGNLQGATGHDLSGMAAKHLAHGSGKIDENSRIIAYSYYNETGIVPVQDDVELEPVIDEENITALPSTSIQEDTSMVYSPSVMALGSGYYARNPIRHLSLPEDRTYIKNLDTGSILSNEIEYSKAFRKELDAHADYIDLLNTTMEFDETVTDGMVRIGDLQLEELPAFRDVEVVKGDDGLSDEVDEPGTVTVLSIKKSKPLIETDEVYIGSFHIKKRMILTTSVNEEDEEDDRWLPCCYQGTEDINGLDREAWAPEQIFNCTCYKTSH